MKNLCLKKGNEFLKLIYNLSPLGFYIDIVCAKGETAHKIVISIY
jgi:hypothetical protein